MYHKTLNQAFYIINSELFLFDFDNIHRYSIDCGFLMNFNFRLKHKKSFESYLNKRQIPMDMDNRIFLVIFEKDFELKKIEHYRYKSNTKKQIKNDFTNYYYITQNLIHFSKKVSYRNDFLYDYYLAVESIKIGANGHSIFLFVNFLEKFFKSYLIDEIGENKQGLVKLNHDIFKIWNACKKKLQTKNIAQINLMEEKLKKIKNLYSNELRYNNSAYNIKESIEINMLVLEVIDYFLKNFDYKVAEMEFEEWSELMD